MPAQSVAEEQTKSFNMSNNRNRITDGKGLFGTKIDSLLLGLGAFFVLINVAVFFGIDTRPNAWLCYLNMSYWTVSVPFSIMLWIIALWAALEMTDLVEDFLRLFRMTMTIGILLALAFWMRSCVSSNVAAYSLWANILMIATVCCIARSAFLFYDYRYERDDAIDMEEAQWFWGMSGFLVAVLIIYGVMSIIPVSVQLYAGEEQFGSASLFQFCWHGLSEMLRNGKGTWGTTLFGLLLFTSAVAFLYVAGQWALIFRSRLREG
jgi:hypothetical protein